MSNLPHQTFEKLQKKNHGVLRGPQFGKQRCRDRLGILRVNLLTTTIVAPRINASKWQMGFNSAFKGLRVNRDFSEVSILQPKLLFTQKHVLLCYHITRIFVT